MTAFSNQTSFLIERSLESLEGLERKVVPFYLSERTYRIVTNFYLEFPCTVLLFFLHQTVQLMFYHFSCIYVSVEFFLRNTFGAQFCFSAFLFWVNKLINCNLCQSVGYQNSFIRKTVNFDMNNPCNFWSFGVLLCLSLCNFASANLDNESLLAAKFLYEIFGSFHKIK